MGASVLHEDAVFPVRKAGIPINIKNTNDHDADGTLIVETHARNRNIRLQELPVKRFRSCKY